MTAEAPGMGKIWILFLMHSFINIAPGSEIQGVPASDIKEIIDPSFNNWITFDKFFFSLNLWLEINFDFISNFTNKFFDILVSSQRI